MKRSASVQKLLYRRLNLCTLPTLGALIFISLGLATLAQAQTLTKLYNFAGGSDGAQFEEGVIQALLASDIERVLWRFDGADGGRPLGALVFDAVGNLYGTTEYAGPHDGGNVFELSPQADGNWTKTVLYNFCSAPGCVDGLGPVGGVIIDSSGNLYGMTIVGGSGNGSGVVFELTPSADGKWMERVLYSLNGNEEWPQGVPALDTAGNLYGALLYGGIQSNGCHGVPCGAVFQLKPGANGRWTYKVVHSFNNNGKDGFWPSAGLTIDTSENLYGVTSAGGYYGGGTVFQLAPGTDGKWREKILHVFSGPGFQESYSPLILDNAGNLYGTATLGGNGGCQYGCGAVFELSPSDGGKWSKKLLHSFYHSTGPNGVILDQAGNLYGTTQYGGWSTNTYCGSRGCGIAYELSRNANGTWSKTTLHSFGNGSDGVQPSGNLVLDPKGNLYGVTAYGGINNENYCLAGGCGTVFMVSPK
jgi:uncharacterized repeat protein (TIGR03803 family)